MSFGWLASGAYLLGRKSRYVFVCCWSNCFVYLCNYRLVSFSLPHSPHEWTCTVLNRSRKSLLIWSEGLCWYMDRFFAFSDGKQGSIGITCLTTVSIVGWTTRYILCFDPLVDGIKPSNWINPLSSNSSIHSITFCFPICNLLAIPLWDQFVVPPQSLRLMQCLLS